MTLLRCACFVTSRNLWSHSVYDLCNPLILLCSEMNSNNLIPENVTADELEDLLLAGSQSPWPESRSSDAEDAAMAEAVDKVNISTPLAKKKCDSATLGLGLTTAKTTEVIPVRQPLNPGSSGKGNFTASAGGLNPIKGDGNNPSEKPPSKKGKRSTKKSSQEVADNSHENREAPNGKSSKKRKINSPNSGGIPKPKKRTFADTVKRDLTVRIRAVGSKLSQEDEAKLRDTIFRKIDDIPSNQKRPIFESNLMEKGTMKVVCTDAFSRDWLLKLFKETEAPCGVKVWAGTDADLSARPEMVVNLQHSTKDPLELIFQRFALQNPGLNTEKWIFHREMRNDSKGRVVAIQVDQETVDYVKSHVKRLYYMMQTVSVQLRNLAGSAGANSKSK